MTVAYAQDRIGVRREEEIKYTVSQKVDRQLMLV